MIFGMLPRALDLVQLLGKRGSALLLGARGVGKTQLAQAWLRTRSASLAIDLLKFDSYTRYLKDPTRLRLEIEAALKSQPLRAEPIAVFIDEIQRVPALLDEIHGLMEQHKGKLQFLLTGSSARKLKRSGANLLAGRALGARLHPLSSLEVDFTMEDLLRLGSLPGMTVDQESPVLALQTYVSTYLKEEIMQEALVRRVDAFARFLEIAGQYHGSQVNATEIAKAAGVSAPTVSEYFQVLEDTLLAFRLSGWNESRRKQLRTSPKFYLFDNGVANALRGELRVPLSPRTGRYGTLFEAWIIQEAFRHNDYLAWDYHFTHWRTNNDMEVDLIVSRGAGPPLAAIEIKSSDAPTRKDVRGLNAFAQDYPDCPLFVFCMAPLPYEFEGVRVMPWRDGLRSLGTL
jgi:predicted AAA+ superfamily ATPase